MILRHELKREKSLTEAQLPLPIGSTSLSRQCPPPQAECGSTISSGCHIFADPFTGDALVEAYSKGERNVGLKVYNDIVSNCPNYFIEMMKEANIAEQVNERIDDRDPDSDDGDAPTERPGEPD